MSASSKQTDSENEPVDEIDWEAFSTDSRDEEALPDDPLAEYILATPKAIAILNLCDCKEQLERWQDDTLRLAQAAKSAHLALQAALIDALSGSASIGAYDDKHIAKWLEFYEASRKGDGRRPSKGRVMSFGQLLDKAIQQPLPWTAQCLAVSLDEQEMLNKLTHVRHSFEHPHPESHFIEPLYIGQTLPVAARLTERLLQECSHHSQHGERERIAAIVSAIAGLCGEIEGPNR